MSATTPECADPISVDEASAQQVRLSFCQLERCSRRALCFLDAEPHWRTWAACAGAWESLSTCTSRRATCSSTSVAGRPQQLSRWCAHILRPCPPIVSHALPSACSGTPVPARRPPASVSPSGVFLACSNLSQPLSLRADGPVFYFGQDKHSRRAARCIGGRMRAPTIKSRQIQPGEAPHGRLVLSVLL